MECTEGNKEVELWKGNRGNESVSETWSLECKEVKQEKKVRIQTRK